MSEALLQLVSVGRQFGALQALDDVSLRIEPGEVVGLVGRHGAGKSVLLEILAGMQRPSRGEVQFAGKPIERFEPARARALGIHLVPQQPDLLKNLDVLGNICLGRETAQLGFLDVRSVARNAREALAELDAPEDLLHLNVDSLPDEQRQVVMLARALVRPLRLLLVDDALAALSYQRQEKALDLLRKLSARGVAQVIVSDNLKALFAVTARIVVLYEGRVVADRRTADSTPREIVELIVGSTRQEQVTPIIWALESYHAAQQQAEELYQAQATLQENLQAQDSLNRQLLQRLQTQVQALDQLNVALQAAQRRLMTEREQERKHLARELHDEVIQDLLSFNYRLEELESSTDVEEAREELAAIRQGIRQVVSDLRNVCSDLRPPTIDSHGLGVAIRSYAQSWAQDCGVDLKLEVDPRLGRLPEAMELSLYRIVQEGLSNIRKHAGARHVVLSIRQTPAASVVLRLADDGQGPDEPIDLQALFAAKHFGLLGISERVALLGGTLQIEAPRGGSFVLTVEIPSPGPS